MIDAPAVSRAPRVAALLGPALVAGVAYLDPGNVASNMTAGALFGYLLVWVVIAGNATAWLIQYLSAKLGIATGASLPEMLGRRILSPWARRAFWLQAEIVAMATDIAEVIGGAIALDLLFSIPLLAGGLITGVISLLLLLLQVRGRAQVFERVVTGMVVVIAVGFCAGLVASPPSWAAAGQGLVPHFEGSKSVLLAVSILGATIMPHAIYAHSALARDRFEGLTVGQRTLMRATKIDVTVALVVAGTVNVAILLVAAGTLRGVSGTDTLEGAYAALLLHLGPLVATLFAVGLLASGLASTSVGAYAGSEIMHGLLNVRVPILYRRMVTLIPALLLLGFGVDPTLALVLSQVVLSFGVPFALVPLVRFTSQRSTMSGLRNRWWTTCAACVAAVALTGLNIVLLVLVL
ncbi:divalent metal cation transporter [Frondihabitans sp. PAMC 28766]|uniref:Nramp family divalent metal transporter n=1 Tax=Frondihabitans sp. PAMC 28766 TaxID=1795630 RepID=UPI00078B4F55|nr:Nramp family divalent metal transporter [Frondihabitans sp. PAMC 28766]AMM22001.1 divalent metal cation transporter [Frondihabitans sp. PAMC 28766]